MSELPWKGLSRWVTAPSLWGGALAAVIAVVYGMVTLALPPGTRMAFGVIATVVVVVGTVAGDILEQKGLRALKGLGTTPQPFPTEALAAAARETAAIPDRSLWLNAAVWVLGSLCIGVAFCLWTGVSFSQLGRILLIGSSMGLLAQTISHLLMTGRSRVLLAQLSRAGLAGEALVAALPKRMQLRPRLVIFAAVIVMVPTLLVTDVSLVKSGEAYEKLLALPRGEQAAYVAEQGSGVQLTTLLLGGLVVVVALWTAYLAGGTLARPLQEISEEAQRIASGALRADYAIQSEDELWAAASAFMAMETQLAGALSQLGSAGMRISSTTEQLVASSSRHDAGAAEQASALNETSATTEELARSARQIAENAAEVAKIAEQTLSAARGGRKSSDAFFAAMARMKRDNQAIADSVVKLNKRVQQIGKVVEFIHEIADKSDLLALNAELEGTKAGRVGRGFSLVAAEMRRLAESVIRSTREIETLIEEIRDATNAAVMATEAGVKATDAGASLANQVSESLRAILELASSTSDAVRSISLATQQQQTGTDQLAEAMGGILTVTQSGAQATRKILDANSELLALSRDLQALVERFRVGKGSA